MRLLQGLLLVLLLVVAPTAVKAPPLGTEFLYQGLLAVNGTPANGTFDIMFTLFRQGDPTPGPSVTISNVPVALGLFNAKLDFGPFDGMAYELGLAVRQSGSGGSFVVLTPHQPLTASPNASFARTVGSVPDSALSGNVPLLNNSPMFTSPVKAPTLRLTDVGGAGLLKFGPTDLCTIGIDPAGPQGLLLRDPRGIRVLSPDPMFFPTLRFGPTDDCSIGIDPAFPGLLLRDPSGIRILPPGTARPTLRFGPTDDCSIGIDPAFPGLIERDPIGFRLLGVNSQGERLIFGPTMDCTIEVQPPGPNSIAGLLLRDPSGIRILSPNPTNPPTLRFGPTDDCSIGIDPAFPGLVERDPIGFRLLGRNNQGERLIFGPTMDCTVEVDPAGPAGLLLRDPSGIRILSPDAMRPPTLRFGPTDDCSIGIDPAFPGLVERDPIGFRLLGRNNQGERLIFGPTMDCTIEVQTGSNAVSGLLLRDPSGIRILSPDAMRPPTLRFGPTDDCSIGIDPGFPGLLIRDPSGIRINPISPAAPRTLRFGPTDDCSIGIDPAITGLQLRDPKGVRILSPDPMSPPMLRFGPTDDCSIGIDPAFPGLVARDPIGFRLLGLNNQGRRLIFGPTMDCTIEVDPAGPQGLLLRDPRGVRVLSLSPTNPATLRFGPTDDCSIGIDPAFPGLVERDPIGFRLLGLNNQGLRLIFGPTMDCTVEIDPAGPAGLLLRDPKGIRILPPAGPNSLPTLRFGPTDDCSIGIDPAFPGLVARDPVGFRLSGLNNQGGRLIFGPTMDCTVEVQTGPNAMPGLVLRDPSGVRILNPSNGPNTILFGPTNLCRIFAPDSNGGMSFSDPRGFTFGSQVTVNGPVFAQAFIQTSSRRFKNDVKPIEQPLEKISKLQGVRFTWDEEKGGRDDLGFIAEDVAEVIPEVVSWEDDGQNARGVNYDHLVAVAIEGIKAQQSQIQTLEREKAELKESLASMQAKLDRLSATLETLMAR
jgi:hypothetical protein